MAEKKEAEKKEPEKAAEGTGEKASKRKKINRLTLAEVEAKLEQIKGTPGGTQTRYAQHLLHRQTQLKKK